MIQLEEPQIHMVPARAKPFGRLKILAPLAKLAGVPLPRGFMASKNVTAQPEPCA